MAITCESVKAAGVGKRTSSQLISSQLIDVAADRDDFAKSFAMRSYSPSSASSGSLSISLP
jgi:hypothetical protein